jgi:outer membrane lipoprotein-sorting protein
MNTKKTTVLLLASLALALSACSTSAKKAAEAKEAKTAAASAAQGEAVKAKAKAKEAAAAAGDVKCKNGTDERTLTVSKTESGCELTYVKFGTSSVLASSANGSTHCEQVLERVKKNLEAASFSCE